MRFLTLPRFLNLALILALMVIALGAYTRLKDAGLGCPDWPACYGEWVVSPAMPDASKAWIEMIHRYAAGGLGLCILGLAWAAWRQAQGSQGQRFWGLPVALLLLVCGQALLGMWTVTLRLYPVVVLAHLMGGLLTITGLWFWRLRLSNSVRPKVESKPSEAWVLGLGVLALLWQCVLGGWTSANGAALVCLDFPLCQGFQNPPLALQEAFQWLAAGQPGSPGSPLSYSARATVHMVHRIWALCTLIILIYAGFRAWRVQAQRSAIALAWFLLAVQLGLGIWNVLAYLPLPTAVLHNVVAVLLLLTWMRIWYRSRFV